jgi:hypothetical protein
MGIEMNHSLYSLDRTSHLKIVTAALLAATVVAAIGVAVHVNSSEGLTKGESVAVIEAGRPVVMSTAGSKFAVR